MSPYLLAFERYTAEPRAVSWGVAMEWHLQCPYGAVVSVPEGFVMARAVFAERPGHDQLEGSEQWGEDKFASFQCSVFREEKRETGVDQGTGASPSPIASPASDRSRLEWMRGRDCWHVWAAAGRLEVIGGILEGYQGPDRVIPWVSFQRRQDARVRIYRAAELFERNRRRTDSAAP